MNGNTIPGVEELDRRAQEAVNGGDLLAPLLTPPTWILRLLGTLDDFEAGREAAR
jgi:hypothetical protein